MIASRQLYDDSIDKIYSFHLDDNIEEMTLKYEQQYLCRYHRKKYRRHQNDKIHRHKLNHNNYDKYVDKKHLFMRIEFTSPSVTQQENNNILFFYLYFTSTTR
jgi:hypothetical protein